MELILWRHADAGDALTDPQADMNRPLSARGRRHADRIARWLHGRVPDRLIVISSPALRARQTADALGRKTIIDDRLAPGCGAQAYLEVAGWPEGPDARHRHVIVIGHQPEIGQAFSLALTGQHADWPFRKSSIAWLCTRTDTDGNPAAPLLRAVIGHDLA
jgi:phosphohistidine phosphatase